MTSPNDLFPVPSHSASRLAPQVWPGTTPKSTSSLLAALEDNYKRWHCFFNDNGFHNHTSHWLLAIWALGANEEIIDAAYKLNCAYQRPAFESPQAITEENVYDHLGDEKYYNAYLNFFTKVVREKGIAGALEDYVFSPEANIATAAHPNNKPQMLDRFFSSLIHPFIYAGYGVEFNIPGLVVEGLAHTAIHATESANILPDSLFEEAPTAGLERLNLSGHAQPNVHALTVLARMLDDSELVNSGPSEVWQIFSSAMKHGDSITRYANAWSCNLSIPGELERKIEELVWMNTIIYGISGWTYGQGRDHFIASFVLMHLVTSSLFLSSTAALLTPASQERLLRSYFVISLSWWVAVGRPSFDISGFFEATTSYLAPSGALPTPHEKSLPSATSPAAVTPNPWLPLLETTLVYPDDHVPKLQRALSHYAGLYGNKAAGSEELKNTELKGAELVDGTLFIRVAGLTAKRMGRMREGEEPITFWDRASFFGLTPTSRL
ncbi:hypothetical protein BDN72DRAFT_872922 [Pluteus cervinus]|uniref:Uncharacterized protein n=1 Tax=Pluteus cervinus TaxID=181527 RepID=A0ACD3A3Q9_9AGAR|nr:hypothetical protein BDN72DRAFT_872922 [Pluteus cervinus]